MREGKKHFRARLYRSRNERMAWLPQLKKSENNDEPDVNKKLLNFIPAQQSTCLTELNVRFQMLKRCIVLCGWFTETVNNDFD